MASGWGPYPDEKTAVGANYMMVRALHPDWSDAAALIATGIGWAESRFGVSKDWILPSGAPSFNWGATVGSGDAGSIVHGDHDKDGKPVKYSFTAWTTPQKGFDFWARLWPAVVQAQSGDASAVSRAMYLAHWFTGTKGSDVDRIVAYAKVILGAANYVKKLLGVRGDVVLGSVPSSSGGSSSGLLLLLLLFALSRR